MPQNIKFANDHGKVDKQPKNLRSEAQYIYGSRNRMSRIVKTCQEISKSEILSTSSKPYMREQINDTNESLSSFRNDHRVSS